jgi:phospholipid/cholesterol/gamma-HCH transport system substrate-binding protein
MNANSAAIDRALAALPGRYEALTRVASHGSWFNFFLCDATGTVGFAGQTFDVPSLESTAPRCGGAGAA